MRLKAEIEYDGAPFAGWQVQPGQLTVQGELERGLLVLARSEEKKNGGAEVPKIKVIGSGRTDAGVHARRQVASFDWPYKFEPSLFVDRLNGITVPEVLVRDLVEEAPGFDARRAPHVKRYCYHFRLGARRGGVDAGRAWQIRRPLNIPAMIEASSKFVGKHDFASFQGQGCGAKSTIRHLLLSEISRPNEDHLIYVVEGCGFLKQMIRVIAGTLVEIGRGERPVEDIERLLEVGDRNEAGVTAPACGLVLEQVRYI